MTFSQAFATKRDIFFILSMFYICTAKLFCEIGSVFLKPVCAQMAEEMYSLSYLTKQIVRVSVPKTFHKLIAICQDIW